MLVPSMDRQNSFSLNDSGTLDRFGLAFDFAHQMRGLDPRCVVTRRIIDAA